MVRTSRNEHHGAAGHSMVGTGYGHRASARYDELHLILSVWLLRDAGTDFVPVEPQAQRRDPQNLAVNRGRCQFGDFYRLHAAVRTVEDEKYIRHWIATERAATAVTGPQRSRLRQNVPSLTHATLAWTHNIQLSLH